MLLAPLAVLGLPGCFGKFTEHYRQRGQLKSFVGRIGIISLVSTVIMSSAILTFPSKFSYLLFRDPTQTGLTLCLGVTLILVSASNFLATLMESLRQVRIVTVMRFITGISFAVLATMLLLLWDDSASAATTGFGISCGIGALPAIWILWKYRGIFSDSGNRLPQATMWKRIAPFAAWLWVANLLNNLIEVSDRHMLIHWSNTTVDLAQGSVGQYHSGRVIPLLLVSLGAVISGALLPYMSEAWEAGKKHQAKNQVNMAIKLVSVTFTMGGALILMLAPLLFNTILQGRYNDGLGVLPITLVYCIWFSLMTIGQEYLWVAEKGKWATLAVGLGLILNVVLNMILIPHFGLFGAVFATAIGNASILTTLFLMNHYFGCQTDRGIWLCALLPLLLVTSKPVAIVATIALLAITTFSETIFSREEKTILIDTVKEKLQRFTS